MYIYEKIFSDISAVLRRSWKIVQYKYYIWYRKIVTFPISSI